MYLSHLVTVSELEMAAYIISNGSGKSEEQEASLETIHPTLIFNVGDLTYAVLK